VSLFGQRSAYSRSTVIVNEQWNTYTRTQHILIHVYLFGLHTHTPTPLPPTHTNTRGKTHTLIYHNVFVWFWTCAWEIVFNNRNLSRYFDLSSVSAFAIGTFIGCNRIIQYFLYVLVYIVNFLFRWSWYMIHKYQENMRWRTHTHAPARTGRDTGHN